MSGTAKQYEIDANFDVFQRCLANYMQTNPGEYGLLRHRRLVEFFKTPGEAYRAGVDRFPDGIFSIQEATDEPIDLGFFSHVAH